MTNKQAVVVIHGMGEQLPLDTLTRFIDAALEPDENKKRDFYSRPESVTGSFESRRFLAPKATLPDKRERIQTEFFEYHWADRMQGNRLDDLWPTFRRILLQPWRAPRGLRGIVLVSWAAIAVLVWASVGWKVGGRARRVCLAAPVTIDTSRDATFAVTAKVHLSGGAPARTICSFRLPQRPPHRGAPTPATRPPESQSQPHTVDVSAAPSSPNGIGPSQEPMASGATAGIWHAPRVHRQLTGQEPSIRVGGAYYSVAVGSRGGWWASCAPRQAGIATGVETWLRWVTTRRNELSSWGPSTCWLLSSARDQPGLAGSRSGVGLVARRDQVHVSALSQDLSKRPIRVAVANDYALVVAGTAKALEPFSADVEVVELDSGVTPSAGGIDVVLYDTFAQPDGPVRDAADVLGPAAAGSPAPVRLLIFSWRADPALVTAWLAAGAAGFVAKTSTAAELVEAIQRVHRGERVEASPAGEGDGAGPGEWPGRDAGLSPRESEVLALICQGLSNEELAKRAFLGINTVKTYIRTAYRKIEVSTRSQAVIWGLGHGFEPAQTLRRYPRRTAGDAAASFGRV